MHRFSESTKFYENFLKSKLAAIKLLLSHQGQDHFTNNIFACHPRGSRDAKERLNSRHLSANRARHLTAMDADSRERRNFDPMSNLVTPQINDSGLKKWLSR
jgi:hypothetical protein